MSLFLRFQKKRILITTCLLLALLMSTTFAIQTGAASCCTSVVKDALEVEQFSDGFFNQPEIRNHLAGAVLVIVQGNQILLQKGYGYADLERNIPVDPEHTVFRLASISKVITATAVLQLVEQGKINLNQNINQYMGDIQLENLTEKELTMQDLLTNSTGFKYGDSSEMSTQDLSKNASLQDFLKENTPTIIREPGQYFRYDNVGFDVQGYIIEQLSGKPFAQYVQEHIFKPLEMNKSHFRLTPAMLANLAIGYDIMGKPIPTYASIPTDSPSGGMLSTGADIANFMRALLNGGQFGQVRVLQEETVQSMQEAQLAIHPRLPNMAYGFEYFYHDLYNGQNVIEKFGDTEGFHSAMWLLPDKKMGIFMVTNNDHDFRSTFFEKFMNHYYPQQEEQTSMLLSAKEEPIALTTFEGIYSDLRTRMWTYRIRAVNNQLLIQDPFGEHVLTRLEALLFEDEQGKKAAFKLNDDGTVAAFYYNSKPDSWAEKLAEPELYEDVGSTHPYAKYIYHLQQLGVFAKEKNTFAPLDPISREEFIGWFIRWSGIAPSNQEPFFTDIKNSPFVREIQTAYELGIIKGTPENMFYPQKAITREEAASIVWKMASQHLYAPAEEALLNDQISEWALEGVQFVVAKGLYRPVEVVQAADGSINYKSKELLRRQEAAALLSLFADNLF